MQIKTEVSVVQNALENAKTKAEFQRVLCVWLKIMFSLKASQIALAICWPSERVRKTQSRFAREGVQCFYPKLRGGRKRENISLNRERQILSQFVRRAKRGFSLDLKQIQRAYELSAGKKVARSTIYRLIERHGLRRYLPRGRTVPG
jgi:transposase